MIDIFKKFSNLLVSYIYKNSYHKLFINVYGENDFKKIGVSHSKFEELNVTKMRLPDFRLIDSYQDKIFNLFFDETNFKAYGYKFGVFDVKNAILEMPQALIRIKGGVVERLMGDTDWGFNFPRYFFSFFRTYGPKKGALENGIVINLPYDGNYFHWLIETLPRLALIESAGLDLDKIKLIMPAIKNRPKFVWESLDLVGWSNRVQHLDSGVYVINNFHIPSLTAPRSRISAIAVDWLRGKILKPEFFEPADSMINQYERIYIARDDAPSRRVINSSKMDELMHTLGFQKVTMSGKSLREQALIFSSAKIIIGVHGAALANIVFCQKGATLIEVFMDGWFTKAFFNLSRNREMKYGCFLAENINENLFVDIDKLNKLICEVDHKNNIIKNEMVKISKPNNNENDTK